MPPFASGTYSAPSSTWNPAVTNTALNSVDWATLLSDLSTALSSCVLKDGTQTITANLTMSGFKLTSLADGSALTDSVSLKQMQNHFGSYLTGVAGTNTVTGTATPTPAYAVGQRFTFIPAVTNTGAVTLNISSVGAGAVQWLGAALTGGELLASLPVTVLVTAATPVFEIINQTQFPDTRALIVGGTDATKKLRFEVDGFTTGTTRVVTFPDVNISFVAPKIVATQRDTSSANGNFSVTGAGFKPRYVRLTTSIGTGAQMSIGFSDGTLDRCVAGNAASVGAFSVAAFIGLLNTSLGVTSYSIAFVSFDADGITVSGIKTGAMSGTGDLLWEFYP